MYKLHNMSIGLDLFACLNKNDEANPMLFLCLYGWPSLRSGQFVHASPTRFAQGSNVSQR